MTRRMMAMTVLVTGLAAIPVLAQGPGGFRGQGRGRGPGGPGGPGPNLVAMVNQLDLSDAQREQLKGIFQEARPSGDPGAAVRDAERKLHEAIFADTPDAAAIENLKTALNAAHAAELDHRIAVMQKVAQVLTPAQRLQLLKLRPQGPPRHH